ncbi:MAG TPA: S8 family serine peptidase [Alphaproteobacteria bacterium]|nr:S8 family serine peptidase [Alphaproteobacteria bacterium]USO05952.1 MAG: S8 family serine peptidase [Rhodospirillales bacterium]HOO82432.1 S8 family serine peptidase [Alphaproteobacteria bacterium]
MIIEEQSIEETDNAHDKEVSTEQTAVIDNTSSQDAAMSENNSVVNNIKNFSNLDFIKAAGTDQENGDGFDRPSSIELNSFGSTYLGTQTVYENFVSLGQIFKTIPLNLRAQPATQLRLSSYNSILKNLKEVDVFEQPYQDGKISSQRPDTFENDLYQSSNTIGNVIGLTNISHKESDGTNTSENPTDTGPAQVIIGIIDQGAYASQFSNNDYLYINEGETPGDGIDNDNNGYIDDYTGYSLVNNSTTDTEHAGPENNGWIPYPVMTHGVGMTNNVIDQLNAAETITGTAPDAKIMTLKFTETNLGSYFGVTRAIEAGLENGARIFSLSFSVDSESYFNLWSDMLAPHDAVLVTYAGSSGVDSGEPESGEMHADNIIKVTRIQSDGSNFFSGDGIEFVEESGAHSSSISIVAGKVAAIWAQDPDMSLTDVRFALEKSASQDVPILVNNGADTATQYGIIDLATAIDIVQNGKITLIDGNSFTNPEQIIGFNEVMDRIDISDVLDGYDLVDDAIADFLQITDNGMDSTVYVDADGGGDNFQAVALILGVTGLTDEQALEASGNIITV